MSLCEETEYLLRAYRLDDELVAAIEARTLELLAAGFTQLEAANEAEAQIYAEIDAGYGRSRPDYDCSAFGVED